MVFFKLSTDKILKTLGQLVIAFPVIFLILHVAFNLFGLGNNPFAVLAIIILLIPICTLVGNKIYQMGIEAGLSERGAAPKGLRKKLEPLLSERPPELETLEVPEGMSRINIDPKDIAPPPQKEEKEDK
jgi:hypothetical protein